IQRGHVFRGHASPDNKDRQQQDQPGYGEPVLSLSPHVPSGYFRALFNTRTARKPLPALLACSLLGLLGENTLGRHPRSKHAVPAVSVPYSPVVIPPSPEPCSTMCATLRPCACKLLSSAAPSVSPSAPTKRNPPRVFPPPRRPAKSSPIGPSRARQLCLNSGPLGAATARTKPPSSTRSARNSPPKGDRKSTRLNSSHVAISYAVFCLKKNTLGDVP